MRKFFGILLLILGWAIAIYACAVEILTIIKMLKTEMEGINRLFFFIGTLIAAGLFCALAYWLIKTGIRLTKKKKVNDTIEKIESIK